MTRALARWADHLRALAGGTARAWWACLPELLFGLALGQLGYHGMLIAASFVSNSRPWVALGLLSLGFSCLLVSYLYCLRTLGRHLLAATPEVVEAVGDAPVRQSLTQLVAVTLLPFLGIYAVFGKVQETSTALYTYEVILRGLYSRGVLTQLNPQTLQQMKVIAGVLAAAYLVRRLLDIAHERTGVRLFGFLTGIVETFFMLVLIFGGTRMIAQGKGWLGDRQAAFWFDEALSRAAAVLRSIYHRLPDWAEASWGWLWGPAWRTFVAGLGSPLLWLAIAALAFGSRISSLSELWRSTLGSHARVPVDRLENSPVAKVAAEVKEIFLGDIDDKYLPTWHSLRLILASGATLVGAFCLLHALVSLLGPGVWWLARQIVGPRESVVWVALRVFGDMAEVLVMEPLRLSLLAVTLLRCAQTVGSHEDDELEVA